jgi:hypothetical protein
MINVYHCAKCGYEWESSAHAFTCPRCGADVEIMVELSLGFWRRMCDTINDMERSSEQVTATKAMSRLLVSESNLLYDDTGYASAITDRRKEIEDMYRTRDEHVRHLIEEYVTTISIDSKDSNYLTARLSSTGEIDIVDQSSGKDIPWHRLNDDEQWALWLCFNDLIDDVDACSR